MTDTTETSIEVTELGEIVANEPKPGVYTSEFLGEIVANEPKPGVYTSEFWLTLAAVASVLTLSLWGGLDADTAALTITGATAGYGVSRGLAKRG